MATILRLLNYVPGTLLCMIYVTQSTHKAL